MNEESKGKEAGILIEFLMSSKGKIVRDEPLPGPNEARRSARHADKIRRKVKKSKNPYRGRR